ncbi:MAG: M20/M25/M40 family metallo-hydrolase [Telluria sp.]
MRGSLVVFVTAAWLCVAGPASSQSLPPTATERLIQEIGAHSQAMHNLEELCDGFGPRLTGSPQLRSAQAWAMKKLAAYGAVNVHEEAYDLGRPWKRGIARAQLLNANGVRLEIVQKGWTAGTGGPLRGEVALLDVKTLEELKAAAPKLKGKIVLVISSPKPNDVQSKHLALYRAEVNQVIGDAHFAAVLLVSGKEGNMQDMWGGPSSRFDRNAGIITQQGAGLLKRLLARGVVPRLEMELGGGFGTTPVKAYNVVADLIGSEAPDEMVIIGAHQDAWDLASGATDNGAGTVVAIEVLRAMHAQGLKPRRTLRIVLFSGEEQGLLGSKAYVARHRAELSKVQAVFVQDAGSGRIVGFPDMKVEAWYGALSSALAPAKALGPLDIPFAVSRGSDHDVFFEQGIPAFSPMQDTLNYSTHTQHSALDTIEHVAKADLVQGAQVMAVAAWGMLNGERLPHQTKSPKP